MVTVDTTWWSDHGPEARLARSLRSLRAAKGTTQAGIARQMSDLGFSWHPTTAARVENGERSITLNEAAALAALLDVNPASLFVGEAEPLRDRIAELEQALAAAENDLRIAQEMRARTTRAAEVAAREVAELSAQLDVLRGQVERDDEWVARRLWGHSHTSLDQ